MISNEELIQLRHRLLALEAKCAAQEEALRLGGRGAVGFAAQEGIQGKFEQMRAERDALLAERRTIEDAVHRLVARHSIGADDYDKQRITMREVWEMLHPSELVRSIDREKRAEQDAAYIQLGLAVAAGLEGRGRGDLVRMLGDVSFAKSVCTLIIKAQEAERRPLVDRAESMKLFAAVLDTICKKAES